MEILFQQYHLIRERRNTLFEYCGSVAPLHFIYDLESFGGKSIRYVLIHMANTYHFWLGHFAGISTAPFTMEEEVKDVVQVRTLFHNTDMLVDRFLKKFQPEFDQVIVNKIPMRNFEIALTPLQLYTHVITHEYHHKGQVLSMSRQLGYTPVDTDLISLQGS
jgi:uncharacterized damage-inducible protein DinB